MQIVIGVRYKTATKTYYFDPNGETYRVGTEVIVDTANGLAFGIVSEANKKVDEGQLELPLRKVVRVATDRDKERVERLRKKAVSVIPTIEKKIAEAGLQMKVVDTEYSFDESKILINFTSDARVDFRELLKMLASSLKVKIELRKVGARDEVCSVGGLGLCGMPCCCTRFLKEPEHITVKMVKQQNLSLSPTKTGGLCGRMMCCLKYEEEMYRYFVAQLPKVGEEIVTPSGKGIVQSTELLKQTVTVKVFGKDDNYNIETFTVEEIKSGKRAEKGTEESKAPEKQDSSKKQQFTSEQSDNKQGAKQDAKICAHDCKNCPKASAECDVNIEKTAREGADDSQNEELQQGSNPNKKKRNRNRNRNKQKFRTFVGSDGGVESVNNGKQEQIQAQNNKRPEYIQAGAVRKQESIQANADKSVNNKSGQGQSEQNSGGSFNKKNRKKFWFNNKRPKNNQN